MFFWKIDDETIRCLINKEEIGQMGFDLKELGEDNEQMEEFLNAVIADSKNYIEWNTENGVQNYIARALPSEQFLITISCTFQDVAIDRDLDQIKKMTTALRERISDDRIDSIYSMTGEEKEREFESLARDLHDVCMGNTSESEKDTEEAAKNVQNTSSEVSYQQSAPTKPSGSTMTDKEKKQQEDLHLPEDHVVVFQKQGTHCSFAPFTKNRTISSTVGRSSAQPAGTSARFTRHRTPPKLLFSRATTAPS